MKKTSITLAFLLLLSISFFALADELPGENVIKTGSLNTIAWVMDVFIPHGEPWLNEEKWEKRVVKTYNLRNNEYHEYSIPKEWVPVFQVPRIDDMLFIRPFFFEKGYNRYDIINWKNGNIKILNEFIIGYMCWRMDVPGGVLPGFYNPIAYMDKHIYYLSKGFSKDELVSMDNSGNGFAYLMPSRLCKNSVISINGDMAALDINYFSSPVKIAYCTQDELKYFELKPISPEHSNFEYERGEGLSWLDEHRLIFWGKLSSFYAPSVDLYFPADYHYGTSDENRYEPIQYPRNEIWHLLCFDIQTETCTPYIDDYGNMIKLVDKEPGNIYVLPDRNKILVICSNYNPVMNLDIVSYIISHELTLISLEDSSTEIIYRTGYEPFNYDLLWEYIIKMNGRPLKEGEDEHALSYDEQIEFEELQTEIPISNGEQSGEVYKFYYDLPAVIY